MSLTGRHALVTAGSRHLGPEIARALARRGAVVAVNYLHSPEAAEELVGELRSTHGGDHLAVAGDMSSSTGVEGLVEATLRHFGRIDILVNNAGPFSMQPFAELAEQEWDHVWDTNVKAAYLAVRLLAPAMRRAGWGRIVNLSAVSAAIRNRSIYGLSKAALEVLTEELALELGPEITVNAVAPGQIRESLAEMAGMDAGWAAGVTARTPLGRLVTRREVAELVALLCTPAFDMMTGATVSIDGGLRINRF